MRSHSFLSPKCVVKESILGGKGIFASTEIEKNELIALWGGIVYHADEIEKLCKQYPQFSTHTVSIFKDYYLGPIAVDVFDDTEMFNHSCDPNVGVKGQVVLLARRKIRKEEELCFDYDTTETTEEGQFLCKCNSPFCRKKIDGSAWQDEEFLKKNEGYLSWYIQELAARRRK
jgi:SET domain-containing protein